MTYSEIYKFCIEKLNNAQITEAESDTRLLFEYLLGVDRSFLFLNGNVEVEKEKCDIIFEAVRKRSEHIPLQHITGKQNFMGLEFNVTKDVLVPRFDTESLVEEAMLVTNDGDKILDVCTGSGCILISLMQYKNNIKGFGCDISEAALDVARKNADEVLCKPECEPELCKPEFVQSDLFKNITEKDFDVIVSNPPYIRSDVIPTLMPEVKDHDPILALDGGKDGLTFYRRIVADAREYLRKGGHLLVEIGHDQAEDVAALFKESGYTDVAVVKDLAGLFRVVRGKLYA